MLGNYITCSRDGRINYWSLDMEKKRSEMPKAGKFVNDEYFKVYI